LDERATPDELLAHIFLAGFVQREKVTTKSQVIHKAKLSFFQGEKEARGRAALVRVLESERPLPHFLRRDLAVLFDDNVRTKAVIYRRNSDQSTTVTLLYEQRKLRFRKRSRNTGNDVQDSEIWLFMNPSDGKKPSAKD